MHFIAIEGCIASGKTTLAKELAKCLGISPTLEDYHDIPSLGLFYQDPETYAFETEIQFTQAHFDRLVQALEVPSESVLVTDFTLKRDLLFATITLEHQSDRLIEYREVWQNLARQLPEPDRVLLLEAPTDELLKRIRRRARPFEQGISREYLERLSAGLRATYQDAPVDSIQRLDSTNLSQLLIAIPTNILPQTRAGS